MKRIFSILIFTVIVFTNTFSQIGTIKIAKPNLVDSLQSVVLKGYFIVSCFDTKIKSNCNLNIRATKTVSGDSMTCGEGNFYKNISTIMYVNPTDLDLDKIDDFSHQIKLQENEHFSHLSINPLILLEISKGDSAILRKSEFVKGIEQNQITAESIQNQIQKLNPNFKKKSHYYILLKVSVKVIALPARRRPSAFRDPMGLDQYLILWDKKNKIEGVKIIKAPF